MSQFKLDIKRPCEEDFNAFVPTTDGGFCDRCKTNVIDFTNLSQETIALYFENRNNNTTCGHFRKSQLTAYTVTTTERKSLSLLSGLFLSILAFFSFDKAQAQQLESNTKTLDEKPVVSTDSIYTKAIMVKGHIVTAEDQLPLPGANIVLQGTKFGTQSDFDGNFEFPKPLKKGDVLVISYVGLKSQKIVISDGFSASKIELEVNMALDEVFIVGRVSNKTIYKSND